MASTYLTRTMGTATSRFTFTLSMWVKRSSLGSQVFWGSRNTDNYRFQVYFDGSDKLNVLNIDNSSTNLHLKTNRLFKDTNGWFHIYVAVKSSESTSSDRCKIYVNGVRETSLETATYQSTSNDMSLGASTYTLNIGRYGSGSDYFDGLMSHCYYVDGSVIAHTQFGSQDTTTGEWKINTAPTISSYGNQGFLILKDGNTVTDQSPNSNNFTVGGGTLTKTEDCPSNVFATMNPLNHYEGQTFTNGNTNVQTISGNGSHKQFVSTLGISSGKFYWELKNHLANTSSSRVGISSENVISNKANLSGSGGHVGDDPESYAYVGSNGYKENNDSQSSYGNSFQSGDILMVALDMDNNKVYFGKNGTWQNSGDPTSGSTGTGAAFTVTAGLKYYPACSILGGGGEAYQWNFGNGYFKTTAISSAGTNASALGIFEYDVPAGYSALCTKGLNL